MIRIGTSGFAYDDWTPRFYPPGLPRPERLPFYARRFGALELNSSFYRQPEPRVSEQLVARTPDEFRFAIKVYGGITHDGDHATRADFARFSAGLQPYRNANKLACVLAQFPQRFRLTRTAVSQVRRLRQAWPDLPVVVEFRHREWLQPKVFKMLQDEGLAFCCVDEPALEDLLPRTLNTPASPAYVRFHGRNAQKWYQHDEAWERYDYLYGEAELAEWLPAIKGMEEATDEVYVFFNNHYDAQAVLNAGQLALALGLEAVATGDRGEGGVKEE